MIEYLFFNVNDSNVTMKLKTENVHLKFDSSDKKTKCKRLTLLNKFNLHLVRNASRIGTMVIDQHVSSQVPFSPLYVRCYINNNNTEVTV